MNNLCKHKEYKALSQALLPDEKISDYIIVNIKNARHLIALTDQRIIMVKKTLLGAEVEGIKLNECTLSSFKSGIFGASFTLNQHLIKCGDKRKAQNFYNLLVPSAVDLKTNIPTERKTSKSLKAFIAIVIGLIVIIELAKEKNKETESQKSIAIQQINSPTKPVEENTSSTKKTEFKKGTLHQATLYEWKNATKENQQATCVEYVTNLYRNGTFKKSIQNSIKGSKELAFYATECVNFFDSLTDGDTNSFDKNAKANESFVMGIMMMGWIE